MKKIILSICLIMGFANAVYVASFCCGEGKTKEQCCAERGRVYCPNENECRTRCPNVTEPDCIGGCINPEGKCCVSCPRTCPEGEYLINADSCYECGKIGCPDGEVMMADGSCQGCVDGYHAYCNVLSDSGLETVAVKSCIGVGCTTMALTECTVQQIDYAQACCTPEQIIYCSSYGEDEKCLVASCGTAGCTPYVRETYEDGTSKVGACCASGNEVVPVKMSATENAHDGGFVNYCVSSGYVAYCDEYDENGKCTRVSTSSSACTPYVSATYEDGTPNTGACCASGKEVQNLGMPDGGIVKHCVSSGYTAYCSSYDENGKCTSASSSSSACTPYKIDLEGTCAPAGSVPYCTTYNADGKCTAATTSLVKDCKPYRKSATEGACCAGTLETVDGSPYPVCSNRL